jgi:hypothetical protein
MENVAYHVGSSFWQRKLSIAFSNAGRCCEKVFDMIHVPLSTHTSEIAMQFERQHQQDSNEFFIDVMFSEKMINVC